MFALSEIARQGNRHVTPCTPFCSFAILPKSLFRSPAQPVTVFCAMYHDLHFPLQDLPYVIYKAFG